MKDDKKEEEKVKTEPQKEQKKEDDKPSGMSLMFPPKLISLLADEVAKRMPGGGQPSKKKKNSPNKKIENGIFLDTSAIIDGRVFDVINLGFLTGNFVIIDSILGELKHIADAQDAVKRERGRNGLELLEKLKKTKGVKVTVLSEKDEEKEKDRKAKEVDDILISMAKSKKGRIITCDYNLTKKGIIQGVKVVNMNELAHTLKIRAVPGESLHVKLLHIGKDVTQGVGYLDDGTMIVVEGGSLDVGKTIDVVVSRVLQTAAGRILFSKKI